MKKRRKQQRAGDNPVFLRFVRTLPCMVCHWALYIGSIEEYLSSFEGPFDWFSSLVQCSPTEAAHVGLSTSKRGLGQKYPDNESIPLCAKDHHRNGTKSIHVLGPERFFEVHGINRDESIRRIQALFVHGPILKAVRKIKT